MERHQQLKKENEQANETKHEKQEIILIDWKRTKQIKKPSYTKQLNLYAHILEHNYNVTVKEMYIVRLHPNSENYDLVKIEHQRSGNINNVVKECLEKNGKGEVAAKRFAEAVVEVEHRELTISDLPDSWPLHLFGFEEQANEDRAEAVVEVEHRELTISDWQDDWRGHLFGF